MSKTTKEDRDKMRDFYGDIRLQRADCRVTMALDDLEAAEAEIARLREQTQWRPIETAPKDGTKILGYVPSDYGAEVVWFSDFDRTWHSYRGANVRPTHWMPLPQPPQESESGK